MSPHEPTPAINNKVITPDPATHAVKVIRTYEKILYACVFITKSVAADNLYKRHVDESVARSLVVIKDTLSGAAVSRDALAHVASSVALVDGYTKALTVSGLVKTHLYSFVHSECTRLAREAAVLQASLSTSLDSVLSEAGLESLLSLGTGSHDDVFLTMQRDSSNKPGPISQGGAQSGSSRTHITPTAAHTPQKHATSQTVAHQAVRRDVRPVQPRAVRPSAPQNQARTPKDTSRSEEVYAFIQQNGKVGIPQLAAKFTGVSSKTIQRELVTLVQAGRIRKEGDRRWTQYSLPVSV